MGGTKRAGPGVLAPIAVGILVGLGGPGAACSDLPDNPERPVTHALAQPHTALSETATERLANHPGETGFHLLERNLDALAARLALARAAEATLDVQYYLFHDDLTGRLMAEQLLEAADRGVRVRLLVDDMDTGGRDRAIAALDQHPRIEVRLFNPFMSRGLRVMDFLFDLGRVSRRMHNKSFIADNVAAIVGGRNIGDEYFQAGAEQVFVDVDVLAMGPAVAEVSRSFDTFWNSRWAVPVSELADAPGPEALASLQDGLEAHREVVARSPFAAALSAAPLPTELREGRFAFSFGTAEVLYDAPEKLGTDLDDPTWHMGERLREMVEAAQREVVLVSAYFVPGKRGVAFLCDLAHRGVSVRVLTNSLAATDVWAVHGGYAPYREDLLRCGVSLHELKVGAFAEAREASQVLTEETAVRLHAKTTVVDREVAFIGSFNMDPRSALHNTEIGMEIRCPPLAAQVVALFDQVTDGDTSYQVVLGEDGRPAPPGAGDELLWIGDEGGEPTLFDTEPDASWWRRFGAFLARVLPVERQL